MLDCGGCVAGVVLELFASGFIGVGVLGMQFAWKLQCERLQRGPILFGEHQTVTKDMPSEDGDRADAFAMRVGVAVGLPPLNALREPFPSQAVFVAKLRQLERLTGVEAFFSDRLEVLGAFDHLDEAVALAAAVVVAVLHRHVQGVEVVLNRQSDYWRRILFYHSHTKLKIVSNKQERNWTARALYTLLKTSARLQ